MTGQSSDSSTFEVDDYPDRPRVLFVGWPESSHTHSWIDLLQGSGINARLFALPSAVPPAGWRVRTYVTIDTPDTPDPALRKPPAKLQPAPQPLPRRWESLRRTPTPTLSFPPVAVPIERQLADAILNWRPHVVHTLGINSASYLFDRTRQLHPEIIGIGRWVVQVRGGPDLALHKYDPDHRPRIESIFSNCDHLIADNTINYNDAIKLGLDESKTRSPGLGVVSGPGGLDVTALRASWSLLPSKRPRTILWPKTYETISSKALPVFEAIRLAWDRIAPVTFELLWLVQSDVQIWFNKTMPDHIKASCNLHGRLDREQVLTMLPNARVMLAPSLTDGIPNSMMEAMALGAFPIVSPLDTITPIVNNEENVLFARNLYPEEIAAALVRAMQDDALVDQAAERNVVRVDQLANRSRVRDAVIKYYAEIAAMQSHPGSP
jgi:glycosyltransferase involved in cell wall biosynthesis